MLDPIKKYLPVLLIVAILGMTFPAKFGLIEDPITPHIFMTVGTYLGLGFYAEHGAVITGVLELIAVILLLIPVTRPYGAFMAMGLMAGAIFFHLFSPLGIVVEVPMGDGRMEALPDLFIMAVIAFLSAAYLTYSHRDRLPVPGIQDSAGDDGGTV